MIENGHRNNVIVNVLMKNGDFPLLCQFTRGYIHPPINTMVYQGAVHRWSRRTAVQDAFLEDRSGGLQDTLDPWIQLLGRAGEGKLDRFPPGKVGCFSVLTDVFGVLCSWLLILCPQPEGIFRSLELPNSWISPCC